MQSAQLLVVVRDTSIVQTLQDNKFSVSVAASLKEAWTMASSLFYHTAIIELTPSDAEEFFALRQDSSRSLCIPIIIISETPDDTYVLQFLRNKVFALLSVFEFNRVKRILEAVDELQDREDRMEIVSATPSWIEITIPAHPAYIVRLNCFFEHILTRLFDEESNKVIMAFRELLQNAIEHGSSFSPQKKVLIRYLKSQHFIIFQIEDEGPGFDRSSLPHAAIGTSKNAAREALRYRKQSGMRPGGLGICYALGAVDEIIYNQKGNAVTIIKYMVPRNSEAGKFYGNA